MMRTTLWAALLLLAGSASADAFFDALTAYNAGDYDSAHRQWLALAEDDPRAQSSLGYMYLKGNGMPRDAGRASAWYRRAAEGGEPGAQLFLGLMYYHGLGLPRDFEQAYTWCELAVGAGLVEALDWRAEAASHLTPEQLARARRQVARWYAAR